MEVLNIACFSCKEANHVISDCPLIHYMPRKIHIFNRYLTSQEQVRQSEFKRRLIKFNTRTHLLKIQSEAISFSKAQKNNDDSRTVHDSDFSGNDDDSLSHSSLLESIPNELMMKRRKSISSAALKNLKDNINSFGKTNNKEGESLIPEESNDNCEEDEEELMKKAFNHKRLGKFTKLHIETNVFFWKKKKNRHFILLE